MSDPKAAEAEAPQARQPEDASPELVEISRGDIANALAGQQPTQAQLASAGRGLGLGPREVTALAAGTSDLRMTPAQYDELKAKLAREYAQAMDHKTDDAKSGSLCGSSGTPAPPVAKQVPPVTSTNNKRKIVVEGTKAHEGTVDGGTVTLRTGAQEDIDTHPDNFTISYKGTDAPNQHWLQFINREVVGIHADGSAHRSTTRSPRAARAAARTS